MDSLVTSFLSTSINTDVTLARVVELHGFGLRDRSDGALVDPAEGAVRGRILGGLFDAELVAAAQESTERRLVSLRADDARAEAIGMVCGGSAQLLLSPLDTLPDQFEQALRSAEPVAVVCPADGSGTDLIVTRRDQSRTTGDADLDDALIDAARQLLTGGSSTTEVVELDGRTEQALVAVIVPKPRGLVVGGGAMADAIAAQGILIGWTVTVSEDLDEAVAWCGDGAPADALIVLSHDADLDTPVLAAALVSEVGYVGAMGSRGTQTNRRKRLRDGGLDEATIDRIHGPVGLDLGSRNPAETAVAIVAEYLGARSGRAVTSLRSTTGSING